MLAFRKLRRGETDHEVIWPMVSLGCLALAVLWIRLHLPVPSCAFHAITGLPCPTCGATRCLLALFHGNVGMAMHFNPLACMTLAAIAAFDLYAVAAWSLRGSRLRLTRARFLRPLVLRCAVIAAIAMNWVYLLHRGDL